MVLSLYNKTERFVIVAFRKADKESDVVHAQRTAHWIKELRPEADEALLIAGLAHDIERAFYGDWKKGSEDPALLRKHQDLSALEIEKFLKQENADNNLTERVKKLVSNHEVGGDEDENLLCDADCLAFLEEKALRIAKKSKVEGNIEEGKRRINMVYERIKSERVKQIAKDWYEKAMEELI